MMVNFRLAILLLTGALSTSGCSKRVDGPPPSTEQIYTLYGTVDGTTRFHDATFDAALNPGRYVPADNKEHCEISASLLNANMEAIGGKEHKVGFWCEAGRYNEQGQVPTKFEGRFPFDL